MGSSLPELQAKLYKQIGIEGAAGPPSSQKSGRPYKGQAASRKELRKAQRGQKKTQRFSKPQESRYKPRFASRDTPQVQARVQNQPPSILKKPTKPINAETSQKKPSKCVESEESLAEDEDEDEDMGDLTDGDVDVDDDDDEEDTDEGGEEEDGLDGDGFGEDESEEEEEEGERSTGFPKATRDRLAQDDAEIAAFEKKLGIKKGRKSLPQSFKDDGLDDLMGDLGGESDGSEGSADESSKRKREFDDWLAAKRRKTAAQPSSGKRRPGDEDEDDEMQLPSGSEEEYDESGLEDDYDDEDGESFGGFDSDEDEDAALPKPKQRENPYVAPTTGNVVAKYVPPSLRKAAGTEGEAKARLRKQIQGLINRLTDANMLSIVQSAEELYQKNARGDVTELLTDIIMAQVCKPESLPDQFFVLTGGFAAAIYKIIGSSFGSHLIRRVVEDFGREYDKVSALTLDDSTAIPKESSNLLTFLSQLYVFEVVSCRIAFDYMERLLNEINEVNVELLLRICRMGGRLLRRGDPQALKHVSGVLGKTVAKVGYDNVSARTKFMVETINDLKNSKPKAKGMDSVVVSEHVMRMKKRLGELKSQSRRLDGLAPMGMSLADIEGADTAGKWWLVGASVPVKAESGKRKGDPGKEEVTGFSRDDEDMDFILPDFSKKARAQGFNKPAQVAIFTALMTAMDFEQGYHNFIDLKLKRDDHLELASVLVQCVGSEVHYNDYYAQVASKSCTNNKIRFALQSRLWRIFRGLGESLFGEDADDGDTADSDRFQDETRVRNVALFYSSLITEGSLSLAILKPLEIPQVSIQVSTFLQWLLLSALQGCKSKNQEREDSKIQRVFGVAKDQPVLAAGLHWFLRKKVRKTKLVGSTTVKKLDSVLQKAQQVVSQANDGGDE
ncbi:hypothetical protein N3K66_001083 [Trichothecium roseum]|uniref:Uncharacterized protein n=1 Tax=Trichothecium roseum TaxID=47278 RepID=A0ACC0VDS1_9HYPO|nr:hypothetical protein N3K66_001083 [Trichothecium roseum]